MNWPPKSQGKVNTKYSIIKLEVDLVYKHLTENTESAAYKGAGAEYYNMGAAVNGIKGLISLGAKEGVRDQFMSIGNLIE